MLALHPWNRIHATLGKPRIAFQTKMACSARLCPFGITLESTEYNRGFASIYITWLT